MLEFCIDWLKTSSYLKRVTDFPLVLKLEGRGLPSIMLGSAWSTSSCAGGITSVPQCNQGQNLALKLCDASRVQQLEKAIN